MYIDLRDNRKDPALLFEYALCDAWGILLSRVQLFDGGRGTVKCSYKIGKDVPESERSEQVFEISNKAMAEAKELLSNSGLEGIEVVDCPDWLDGIKQFLYLNDGESTRTVRCYNLQCWAWEEEMDPNAAKVLGFLESIVEILAGEGIDERYFRLSLEGGYVDEEESKEDGE